MAIEVRITPPKFPAAFTVQRPSGEFHCCGPHARDMVAWCNGMDFKPRVAKAPPLTVCAICTKEYRENNHA